MLIGPRAMTAAVVVTVGLAVDSCSSEEEDVSAAGDVAVSVCATDPAGGSPASEGQITNHSSEDSSYAFSVSFIDIAGNKVSEGAVAVGRVPAGGQATWRTQGLTGAKGPLTCRLSSVIRTAVP